jgi:hypothetical protein
MIHEQQFHIKRKTETEFKLVVWTGAFHFNGFHQYLLILSSLMLEFHLYPSDGKIINKPKLMMHGKCTIFFFGVRVINHQ